MTTQTARPCAKRLGVRRETPLWTAIVASTILLVLGIATPATRAGAQGGGGRTVRLPPVTEMPSSSKRWALVIGVDEYADEQISALRGSANDARTLAAALVANAGFPADQVIVLATGEPESRLPTRTNILKRLSNLSTVVPKDGLLLVSFSGHGMERSGQAFLLPSDATAASDLGLLEETAVSVSRMHERIRATGVSQVLVLLDACRNDPSSGRADSTNALSAAYTRGFDFDVANREVLAYATLHATSVGARAYEYVEKRQGYFTWAVVEGLKGAAADESGRVTLAGLVRFVEQAVPKRVGVDYGAGKQQKPFARIEGYRAEDLVLSVAANRTGAPVATAPTTGSAGVDPKAVELELWATIKESRDAADFDEYLKHYPAGAYAAVARAKIKQLRGSPTGTRPGLPGETRSFELRNGVSIEMVYVDSGSFTMGSLSGPPEDQPIHRVSITKPFSLGKFEVTQEQWAAVMGTSPSKFKGSSLPVESVSWNDVQEFLGVLNAKSDGGWRLPTEAEWEYACRAGSTGDHAGDLDVMAWYTPNSGNETHPVGQKRPNAWGLHDIHGNVLEWCSDWFGPYTRDDQTDPTGARDGSVRIFRGGAYNIPAVFCKSGYRSARPPDLRENCLGFRLARTM